MPPTSPERLGLQNLALLLKLLPTLLPLLHQNEPSHPMMRKRRWLRWQEYDLQLKPHPTTNKQTQQQEKHHDTNIWTI